MVYARVDAAGIYFELSKNKQSWTESLTSLQELLAPKTLQFFSSGWTKLGSRNPSSELEANHIKSLVTDITGIAGKYLEGNGNLHTATVATRMSWAARRQTSRPEDMAYSLLGIFDINMPLLYGEGEKAYIRLQEEIIKISTDQSIFAWEFMPEMTWAQPYEQAPKPQLSWVSLLAPRPICFRNSIFTRVRKSAGFGVASEIYSMTNVGLSIHLPLLTTTSPKRFFGVLQCYNRGSGVHQDMLLCVPLQKFKDTFIRTTWPPVPLPLCWSSRTPPPIPLHVPRYQRLNHEELRECFRIPTFDVSTTHLILFTTTMADLNLRAWSTTAQSTLLSVHSLLISRTVPRTAPVPRTGVKVLEGGGLSFSPTGETAAFTAMVAIDSDDRSFASSGQLGGATWCRLCDTESELASGKAFEEQTLGSLNQQTMNVSFTGTSFTATLFKKFMTMELTPKAGFTVGICGCGYSCIPRATFRYPRHRERQRKTTHEPASHGAPYH